MDKTAPPLRGAFIAKLGAWLQMAPVLSVFGMAEAFSVLRTSGAGDPARLGEAIGNALIYALIAKGLSIIGLVLTAVAITFHRYRSAWMFHFLCFYGLLMIGLNACLLLFAGFSFNIHLFFGVFFVCFAMAKKNEFQRAAKAAHKLPSCYNLDP